MGSYGEQLAGSWGITLPAKLRRYSHIRIDENYAYFPVKRVEHVKYHGPVVNLSVARNHTYCLPCVVHNCWLEKDALSGVFIDVIGHYRVTLNVGRGYDGWSSIHNAAERFKRSGKETIILYFGDFDPSGEDMVRSLRDRLEILGSQPEIIKVALGKEDVARYNLPPNMTKSTDTRRTAFVAKHGDVSVELDALPAPVLQQMVRSEIEKYIDLEALDRIKGLEQKERAQIVELLSALDDTLR